MKTKRLVVGTGFALFSMFFGSGNLVFPIAVGKNCEGHYILASLGLLFTCVGFPLLGMLGMALYKGSLQEFFNFLGRRGTFLFSFLALSLMGPFGVLARCLTVVHGALLLIFPNAHLPITSLFMCIIVYFLTQNKNKIIGILGNILTPFLLLSIIAIVFFGLNQGELNKASGDFGWEALKLGFFQGYQTMDLVASFFFSGFVLDHLYRQQIVSCPIKNSHALIKIFIKSSLIGALLLYAIYFSLILLGWLYASTLEGVAPEEMLGHIALQALGPMAAPCVCLAVIFSCLTTAIALTSLFAEFLKKKITKNKINNQQSLFITLGIGFLVSNLEFAGIAKILAPILETIYPALIMLTLINIALKIYNESKIKTSILNSPKS